jgi:hypothetical protein
MRCGVCPGSGGRSVIDTGRDPQEGDTTMTDTVKMMRLFSVVLALALFWGACGDDDDSSGNAGGSGGTGATGGTAGDGGAGGSQPDAGEPDGGEMVPDAGEADAAAGGECVDGCTCDTGEACEYVCAADCTVECLGSHCTAECPEGGCTLDADFQANTEYTCEGGGCTMDCDNTSICGLDCSGGGCEVTCDVDSTCTVTCPDTGDACKVTCENGGRAVCDGNCTLENCDATCEPDPTYQPEIDPEDFSTTIDNPLFPLPVGAEWIYEGPTELITVTVLDQTKTVAMEVECVVVHDEVRDPKTNELLEDTYDWYAQDSEGNVWYMGEDTAEYLNGEVATRAGSWEAGKDGALPGIIMEADPKVDDVYRQEYLACEAEDWGEVVEVDVEVTGQTTGNYTGCVNIRDFTPLEPSANEIKTYCPDVGVVRVIEVANADEPAENLTSVTMP